MTNTDSASLEMADLAALWSAPGLYTPLRHVARLLCRTVTEREDFIDECFMCQGNLSRITSETM